MMDDRIRTSDADRDRVADRLRDHYAEGRLTRDEFDERLTTVLNARTFGDLRGVLTDLPEPALMPAAPRSVPAASRSAPPVFRYRRRGPRLFPIVVLALLAIVVLSGGGAALVVAKVIAIMAAIMLGLFVLTAVTAARFVHRVRRQWYHQQFHQRQLYRQSWFWPEGYGRR